MVGERFLAASTCEGELRHNSSLVIHSFFRDVRGNRQVSAVVLTSQRAARILCRLVQVFPFHVAPWTTCSLGRRPEEASQSNNNGNPLPVTTTVHHQRNRALLWEYTCLQIEALEYGTETLIVLLGLQECTGMWVNTGRIGTLVSKNEMVNKLLLTCAPARCMSDSSRRGEKRGWQC